MTRMTPYELNILLDVYCGSPIRAASDRPLFVETVNSLCERELMRPYGDEPRPQGTEYYATDKLRVLVDHMLSLPDPVWVMP